MNLNTLPARSNLARFISLITVGLAGCAVVLATSLHGADTAAPAATPAATPAAKAVPFSDVEPVLKKYCYSCHGGTAVTPATVKGGLALDTQANALKGGKSKKPALVVGKGDASDMIIRMKQPATAKSYMPQNLKGKPAPTAEEIKKLVDWINAGASWK